MRNNLGILACVALSALAAGLSAGPALLPRQRGAERDRPRPPVEASAAGMTSRAPARELPSPERLARAFAKPAPRAPRLAPQAPEPQPEPEKPIAAPPVPADWLRPLGAVEGVDGTLRLYFKDSRNGALLSIRGDGSMEKGLALLETTAELYLIEIEGARFTVKRRK